MSADIPLTRDLLERIAAWPGASDEARRLAAVMWHEVKDPGRADADLMESAMGRLTGELRRCRVARDPQAAADAAALRDQVAALSGDRAPWGASPHDVFAGRTLRAARAAGLDLRREGRA
jgi:hypothetical protein